jgi:hypothetical protein
VCPVAGVSTPVMINCCRAGQAIAGPGTASGTARIPGQPAHRMPRVSPRSDSLPPPDRECGNRQLQGPDQGSQTERERRLMSGLTNAMIINAVVLSAVLEADLGQPTLPGRHLPAPPMPDEPSPASRLPPRPAHNRPAPRRHQGDQFRLVPYPRLRPVRDEQGFADLRQVPRTVAACQAATVRGDAAGFVLTCVPEGERAHRGSADVLGAVPVTTGMLGRHE